MGTVRAHVCYTCIHFVVCHRGKQVTWGEISGLHFECAPLYWALQPPEPKGIGDPGSTMNRRVPQDANRTYGPSRGTMKCLLTRMRRFQAVRLNDSETHWTILCTADDPDFLPERPRVSATSLMWGSNLFDSRRTIKHINISGALRVQN
jgi:hypothetical protein